MVEASMVLPLLILSVITCLLVSMFFYDTTLRQCQLHQALRCEAADLTGETINLHPPAYDRDSLEIKVSRQGVFHTVSGKEHTAMIHQGILHSRVSAETQSLWHASDGVAYVRYCTITKKLIDQR